MKRLLGIGLVSFWLTSCMLQPDTLSQFESALEKPSQFESVLEEPSSTGSQVACTQDDPSTRSPTQASSLVANLNTLGIDLYHTLTQSADQENLIFSPYGVVSAFSAAYAGAAGETEAEMVQFLHFLPQSEQHSQYRTINCYLTSLANDAEPINQGMGEQHIPFQLQIANGLWQQAGFPFSQGYLGTIAENYSADLQTVDFVTGSPQVVEQINQWVRQKTAGRIQELVTNDEVTSATRLVIANAIYFKASWLIPFSPSQTQVQPFALRNGDQVMVPLMHNTLRASYLKAEGYQAALLPYFLPAVDKRVEMVILVPDPERFSEIEQSLDLATVADTVANAEPYELTLALPKFELNHRLDLRKVLSAIGLQAPFEPAQANFSRITGGENGLYISAAIQQATITVDEQGTEAAAATGIPMPVSKVEPAELIVNRPFIYAIRETESNAILFLGRVVNPVSY